MWDEAKHGNVSPYTQSLRAFYEKVETEETKAKEKAYSEAVENGELYAEADDENDSVSGDQK